MKSREIATVAVFTSLAVVFRVLKNIATPIQLVNIPLALALTSAILYGARVGFLVGLLSYIFSDVLIFPGVWSIVNGILAGLIATLYRWVYTPEAGRAFNFVATFLLVFAFDILTSGLLYVLFGVSVLEAFIVGLVGLFFPVMGGYLVGIGPLTETSTSLLTIMLIEELKRRNI
ncbi:ECF transporter S component [Infirmifilum lucidum]|uniref:ECF transporter S component n=1 Tax=Infirmifilum lucidum TaxID=2776706 RepID=A0A7L9FFJ9_9CREN|nr:ECF transporter S component [Infirmifilum lucidum]QOJ78588.1 ECF transporter S component [Infirmifilum lucidum]